MTPKQWNYYYNGKSAEEVFDKYWNDYKKNDDYNIMYYAYRKCERALKYALDYGEKWVRNYVYNPSARVIERIIQIAKKIYTAVNQAITIHNFIDWNGYESIEGEQFYLIKLYNRAKKFVWLKIGTTSRNSLTRFADHLNSSSTSYLKNEISFIKVLGLWKCEGLNATDIENRVRDYLKNKYGEKHYIKNDRFDIEDECDELHKKIPPMIEKLKAISLI